MEIVTENLVLREFVEGDFEAMLAYQADPRYRRYYETSTEQERYELAERLIGMFVENQKEEPRTKFQLAITLRENGKLIGNVGIRKPSANARDAEMGCEIAPDYWERGYATEAGISLLKFGFEQLGLHRIWASTIADNAGAYHVLEKLGMRREGELRETTKLAYGWANSVIYGILESEWNAEKKRSKLP